MTIVQYDGSFEGLLTAVFEIYAHKIRTPKLQKQGMQSGDLFSERFIVETDEQRAKRVATKIEQIAGKAGLAKLWKATLTELDGVDQTIVSVIRYLLKEKRNILNDYGHPDVLQIAKLLKKISRERHRMTAFVRFEQATDSVYYATIEPDFDVLPLIKDHFKNRYADQKWLIFDLGRNYGIYYDLQTVVVVEPEENQTKKGSEIALSIQLSETEQHFQKLWQQYFQSTGINSRKNNRLHLQHVPKRYWKHLTEKW